MSYKLSGAFSITGNKKPAQSAGFIVSVALCLSASGSPYEAQQGCEGLLLLQHGLVTFGDSAQESY